jgi:hypothetical protein
MNLKPLLLAIFVGPSISAPLIGLVQNIFKNGLINLDFSNWRIFSPDYYSTNVNYNGGRNNIRA